MSIKIEAAKSTREGLIAMRDKLASDMDDAEPGVVAQIAGRLQAVLKELDSRAVETKGGSTVDEIAKRRENRLPNTDGPTSSGRRRNVRRG